MVVSFTRVALFVRNGLAHTMCSAVDDCLNRPFQHVLTAGWSHARSGRHRGYLQKSEDLRRRDIISNHDSWCLGHGGERHLVKHPTRRKVIWSYQKDRGNKRLGQGTTAVMAKKRKQSARKLCCWRIFVGGSVGYYYPPGTLPTMVYSSMMSH